jgi:hypothetical protein
MVCLLLGIASTTLVPNGWRSNHVVQPRVLMALQVVDLFPDPPTVGGNAVVPPPSRFPAALEVGPLDETFSRATLTPFPTFVEVVSSPLQPIDIVAGVLLGIALLLGPDFLLVRLTGPPTLHAPNSRPLCPLLLSLGAPDPAHPICTHPPQIPPPPLPSSSFTRRRRD